MPIQEKTGKETIIENEGATYTFFAWRDQESPEEIHLTFSCHARDWKKANGFSGKLPIFEDDQPSPEHQIDVWFTITFGEEEYWGGGEYDYNGVDLSLYLSLCEESGHEYKHIPFRIRQVGESVFHKRDDSYKVCASNVFFFDYEFDIQLLF